MTPFDRILLCYDATPEGQRALRCGAALAKQLDAETHLLSVLDLAWWPAGYDAFSSMKFDVDENAAREILQDGIARLQSWGVTATGHSAVGDAAEQISNLANSLKADLIVIGHRRGGFVTRWLAGGSHLVLLDRVSCGVLFEVVD
ncbi:universal stress protein [Paraburkholderia sp. D1E]|uniref:universal stress protein n=1 Tax=Paraburkholderia sp. D1E TaxID=3461398 RepID=UPI0040457BF2